MKHNPGIDWKTGKLTWKIDRPISMPNNLSKWKQYETTIYHMIVQQLEDELWLQSKTSISQEFAKKEDKPEKPLEEMIPPKYHEYLDLFRKSTAARLPKSRSWDHKIDLKEGFVSKTSKVYPISKTE